MHKMSNKISMRVFMWKNSLRKLSVKWIYLRNSIIRFFKAKARACHIYKTSKAYKIVTIHRRSGGALTAAEPVYILSLDSPIEDISKSIFESLSKSGKISEEEYFKIGGTDSFLKMLKERSLKQLYNTSNSCHISLVKDKIEIAPYKKVQRWLEQVDEDKITLNYSKEKELEITQQILKILDVSYHYS